MHYEDTYEGPAELNDSNWGEAFGYAGEPGTCAGGGNAPSRVEGATCTTDSFARKDVAVVLASTYGEHDGESWEVAGVLFDGRWFYLCAGCDYTGWDCVASGQAWVADDKDQLVQFGIPADTRDRWGLS